MSVAEAHVVPKEVPSDIAIAQTAHPRPIVDVAADLGLTADDIDPYGKFKAKLPLELAQGPEDLAALERGLPHLAHHVRNVQQFRVPVVVALNRRPRREGGLTRTGRSLG